MSTELRPPAANCEGNMSAIIITNLTKKYGELTAVDSLNLTVEQGELFALF